jgi:integrase
MPATTTRIKGIKRYFEPKAGKYYCYHRATGKRIKEEFGSPEFFERLAQLNNESLRHRDDLNPGSLKALILKYKTSGAFQNDLAPRTRSDYEKVFAFLTPLWDVPLSSFTTPQIVKLRETWRKERGHSFINKTRAVLSILFNHGIEEGLMSTNPVRDVKQIRRPKDARTVNRPWTLSERRVVMAQLPSHLRLPVAIALFSGMREGDVISAPPTIINENKIRVRTAKRNVWIDIPILPELAEALEAEKVAKAKAKVENTRLCTNSRGEPWTLDGFSCSFRKAIKKLEKAKLVGAGLTFHGLRHTVATTLAEAGVSEEDIAAVLGQKTSRMAAHYAREADRSRRTKAAIRKFKPLGWERKRNKSV